ncbi:MAG: TonB-dependent siderophore receptor [Gammaproteobacteria bacterium]
MNSFLNRQLPAAISVLLIARVAPGEVPVLPEVEVRGAREQGHSRTGVPLKDLPQSIQVIPREVIEEQKAYKLDEVLKNVSGIAIDNSRGFNEVFIVRGFTPSEGSVVLRDEFPEAVDDLSPFAELANIEQVEVRKGPAAFLHGRFEPGGVINLVTRKPLPEPFYSAHMDIGSYDFYRPAFDISGPLTEAGALLYRFNGVYEDAGSFRDFVSSERWFLAPALTWKPSARSEVIFQGEYLRDERTRDTGIVALGRRPADIPISRFLNDPSNEDRSEIYRTGYELKQALGKDWRLRNAFRYLRLEGSYVGTVIGEVDEETGEASRFHGGFDNVVNQSFAMQTELTGRVQTGPIGHTSFLGFDLTRNLFSGSFMIPQGRTPGINIFNPVHGTSLPAVGPIVSWEIQHDIAGAYFQDLIALFEDRLKLFGGGRFDLISERDEDPVTGTVRREQGFDHFSPRAGIVFQPFSLLSLYGGYGESFVPVGGTNADEGGFEPTIGRGYEAGLKLDALGGRLFGTLAFYRITKENVLNVDPDPARASQGFRVQTGEEESEGIELDLGGTLMPGWEVLASYALTDARITKDTDPTLVGRRKPNVPEHAASLWTRYEIQTGALRGLSLGAGVFYAGEREGDLNGSFELPSYLRADTSIGYRYRHWNLSLNVHNLFDKRYFVGGERTQIFPGEPLTVIGAIEVSY